MIAGGFGIPSSPADFNWDGIVDEQDLELMNFCMGAITDPNIVKLDTSFDSRVNLPDFGIFSFDYGYSSDPNVSSNNDPNCQRSDFNTDDRVDLADLEILAEHWLTAVMDEYRICSRCHFRIKYLFLANPTPTRCRQGETLLLSSARSHQKLRLLNLNPIRRPSMKKTYLRPPLLKIPTQMQVLSLPLQTARQSCRP